VAHRVDGGHVEGRVDQHLDLGAVGLLDVLEALLAADGAVLRG
jgi:hypothetical protein